ncbi:hypothetical protein DERP_010369 [Dermatophagoides pteronyssinus]|uniref:Uncharacterized protein n=1 Tax=Dermatophagoides pteronyssinus TaxID=6956 RepID=A0ABQ8IYX9_DERPT|nr:hypothetical protein DERP_010369 [Dermatophagoides pteronyssinus]
MSESAVPLVLSRISIVTTWLISRWVNNPTLGEFCFAMIGRADIEGSKSDVAMNAWPPQASYPCGRAFAVRIRTGNQDQASFCPFTLREKLEAVNLGDLLRILVRLSTECPKAHPPCLSSGILTRFPFGKSTTESFFQLYRAVVTDFSASLGPTEPCPTAVHMEPFSTSDDRFARQNRYRPPPEFPLASSCPGIVHHLSGTIVYAPASLDRQKTNRPNHLVERGLASSARNAPKLAAEKHRNNLRKDPFPVSLAAGID